MEKKVSAIQISDKGLLFRIYKEFFPVDVWQKTTKFYKAIIIQLKINKFKKKEFLQHKSKIDKQPI